MKFLRLACCFYFLFSVVCAIRDHFGNCTTPFETEGECIFLEDCAELRDQKPITERDIKTLKDSQCGFYENKVVVCCEIVDEEENILPTPGTCGFKFDDRVYNGTRTLLGENPWSALLQYTHFGGSKSFDCGGALINRKYVITAGHCVSFRTAQVMLTGVRLGEYDTSTEIDCDNVTTYRNDCATKAIDFKIDKIIVHENYDTRNSNRDKYDDIALIKLAETVTYSYYISPICLPTDDYFSTHDLAGAKITVSGWGRMDSNENSSTEVKLKVELNVWSNDLCNQKYSMKNISSQQICAGGHDSKDVCRGDSGNGLAMFNTYSGLHHWVLVGVVSHGVACGQNGWPGINTRISSYMSWIQENLQ